MPIEELVDGQGFKTLRISTKDGVPVVLGETKVFSYNDSGIISFIATDCRFANKDGSNSMFARPIANKSYYLMNKEANLFSYIDETYSSEESIAIRIIKDRIDLLEAIKKIAVKSEEEIDKLNKLLESK